MFFKKLALGIHFRRKVMTLNIIHKTAINDANTPTSLNRFSITQIKNIRLESQKTTGDDFHNQGYDSDIGGDMPMV